MSKQEVLNKIFDYGGGFTKEEKMFGDDIESSLKIKSAYNFNRKGMDCVIYYVENMYVCQIRTNTSKRMGDYCEIKANTPYKLVRLIAAFGETPYGFEVSINNLKQKNINMLANSF